VASRTQVIESELASGRIDDALSDSQSLLGLLGMTRNPDDREGILWSAALVNLAAGRIAEAREHARRLLEAAGELTPHHRIHGVALGLMIDELAGRWEAVDSETARAEHAVAANLATPCTMNARALLVCALAAAHCGDETESRRLELHADALEMEGYGLTIEAPRLRLSLLRGDLEAAERLLESGEAMYFARTAATAARLDALAALGRREGVEDEAGPLLQRNIYLQPFALRALGQVRGDKRLVAEAIGGFERMGLDWHADQTRALL
jgi:hypothetical protein